MDKKNLVMLHGWGANAGIFEHIHSQLQPYFNIYNIDLAGYGFNAHIQVNHWQDWVYHVLEQAPSEAIYLGWSLGGLIATQITLDNPKRVLALVTVTSSPRFCSAQNWYGMDPKFLSQLSLQLSTNLTQTLENFIDLQARSKHQNPQQIKAVKQAVFSRPIPNRQALNLGLSVLNQLDLSARLEEIESPFLRLYGRLDKIVPRQSIPLIDKLAPKSQSKLFIDSAHAPFLTQTQAFCDCIIDFVYEKLNLTL